MMLIITDKEPEKNSKNIIKWTNKNFVFKSLMELAQLLCSCGLSDRYKSLRQAKEIQAWIKDNKLWVYRYYTCLWFWCVGHLKMKPKTLCDLYYIRDDLYSNIKYKKRITYPKSAIFRYKKGYLSNWENNSNLPIDICCKEYKKYLRDFKGFGVVADEIKWD